MSQIRTLIVDDDFLARERLQRLLEAHKNIKLIGEASNGAEALQKIAERKPDLVFMDIEMPVLNGIEAARSLGAVKPMIVFATAFDAYAVRAFEVNAVDYILKPVQNVRLAITLDKVSSMLNHGSFPFERYVASAESYQKNRRISFVEGKEITVLSMDDISLVMTEDRYSQIYFKDKTLLIDEPLQKILERLDKGIFLFAHRNALVNVNYIERLKREGLRKYSLLMKSPHGVEVNVSRGCLAHIRQILNNQSANFSLRHPTIHD